MGRRARIAAKKRSFSTAVQKGKRIQKSPESRPVSDGTCSNTPCAWSSPARRKPRRGPTAGRIAAEQLSLERCLETGNSKQKDQNKSRRVVAQKRERQIQIHIRGKSKCDCLVWFLKLLIKKISARHMRSVDSFEELNT